MLLLKQQLIALELPGPEKNMCFISFERRLIEHTEYLQLQHKILQKRDEKLLTCLK